MFKGMAVLAGRRPPHAGERSRALIATNHQTLLFSELLVDVALRAVKGERLPDEPLPIDLPEARTIADRDALVARIRPSMGAMIARWGEVPEGGTLVVVWPEAARTAHARRSSGRRGGGVGPRPVGRAGR
jgi:hypothetical protein